jgi:integrase
VPRKNRGPYLDVAKSGYYEIRFTVGGRSRCRSTGTRDFQLAQKILANFILLGEQDRMVLASTELPPMLVMDALGDPEEDSEPSQSYWHEHVLRSVVGVDTQRYAVRKLRAHFGHLAVRDVRPTHVAAYCAARRSGALGKPSVDGTIARELSVLAAAINHQVRARRIKMDEAPVIELPKPSEPRDRWLTQAEADRLLAAAREAQAPEGKLPRVYRFVVLALATASRKTALLELRKSQVDLEQGLIRLNPYGRQQTKKRRPMVPISDDLMPIIKRIVEEAPGEFLLDHPGSIRTAFDRAVIRAGLGDVTPHTLRHTAASWMLQEGVPIEQVAAILGDTIATVERTYGHHCKDRLRSAVNTIRLGAKAA